MLSLSNDAWLETATGKRLSIREALLHAHEVGDLVGCSQIETYSIYRFLTAVLQSSLAPTRLEKIHAIRSAGRFDRDEINVFCNNYPMSVATFMQCPDLNGDPKSIGYLTPDIPTGSNSIFFTHRSQDEKKVYCERCIARGLLSVSAWQTIGGQGLTASINGAPPLYVLPYAPALFDALVMCLTPQTDHAGGVWGRSIENKEYENVPYLHALTFMPRQVRVLWEHGQNICTRCGESCNVWATEMIHKKGEKIVGNLWRDPFCAYAESKKGSNYALRVSDWSNDLTATVTRRMSEAKYPPAITRQWPEQRTWRVFGAVTKDAKWVDEFTTILTK